MTRNLRILVVDDTEANRRLICRFVTTLGHQAIPAADGSEAVALCQQQLPDLVLMDIMMPGMDGIETSLELRKLCGNLWLPIIFLSARAEEADQLHGLGFGDDYLPKPVNLAMLEARINVMARIAEMQQRLAEYARRLEAYRRDNELELSFTRHLLERIMGNDRTLPGPVEQWIKPAHKLSGDVISHAYAPTGTLHLLLADSTGHGPAAAIGALPAVDAFQSMTRRGFDIGSIAREINAKLHCLLPRGHFVSAALLCMDPHHHRILAWNGGIPVVLHVDAAGRPLHQWASRNPPLGILPDSEFTATLESCPWDGAGQIYLGSDGVTEAENAQGQRFGHDRLLAALAENGGEHAFEHLIGAVVDHLGEQDNHDDIALACVRCAPEQFQPKPLSADSGAEAHPFRGSDWSLSLRFSAQELRQQDNLPRLVSWLNQLGLNGIQLQEMLLITTELYNNAMDHGVLRLDSTLKLAPQGFDAYLAQRDARLSTLHHGHIDISLEHQPSQQRLRLRIQDSGAGFDHVAMLRGSGDNNLLPYGRGLQLVKELASSLEYNEHGNQAIVEYLL